MPFPLTFARTLRALGLCALGVCSVSVLSACGGGGSGGESGSRGGGGIPAVTDLVVSVVIRNTDCALRTGCGNSAITISANPEFMNAGASHNPLKSINAHFAYARGESTGQRFTGRGVTVAVVDHGIDMDHPEFTGRITLGYNTAKNEDPNMPEDDTGHGTAVAGIIAAAKDDSSAIGAGMHGVAYESVIIPVRALVYESNSCFPSQCPKGAPPQRTGVCGGNTARN